MNKILPHSQSLVSKRLAGILTICLGLALSLLSATAQTRAYKITGSVKDAKGAQRGVVVRIDKTNFGGVSDPQGNYTINANLAPGKYTVAVAAINYKQFRRQITLGADNNVSLDVKLEEDVTRMDEVVVTGTSAASSRKTLGNSIGAVNAKDVQQTGANAIDAAMAGKIAGVQIQQNSGNPAGGVSLRLRGTNTFSGSAEPLYIIDGVIVNNDSRELVDLGGSAVNRIADINPNDIERIEVLKGASAAAIYGSRANNGVVQIFTKRGAIGAPTITFSTRVNTDDLLRKIAWNQEPLRLINGVVVDKNPNGSAIQRYDLQDMIFRRAWGIDNYISVAGGSQGTKYFLSANQTANQGIIGGTSFNRAGARLRVEQVLSDQLTATLGINYVNNTSRDIPNGGLNSAYGALTGFSFAQNYIDPRPKDGVYEQLSPPNIVTRTNPLEAIDRFDFSNSTSRITTDFQINYIPLSGLSINYVLGYDTYSQIASAFIPRGTTTPLLAGGFSRRANANIAQINNDLTITYTGEISEGFKSTTQLGGTLQYEAATALAAQSESLAPVAVIASSGAVGQAIGDSRSEISIYGAFLQQSFDINNMFFLTGAVRMDASSVFGVNNRVQFFPKVSGSALLSELWKDSDLAKILPTAKLRAAWGQSGGLTAIGAYTRFTNYNPTNLTGLSGLLPSTQIGSVNVKPERQTELEIGTDLALLENRLGLEFSWYNKVTTDLLLNRTIAPTTGFSNLLANVGTLTSNGIELLIRAVPMQTEDFKWSITGIYNQNRSIINGVEGGFLQIADGFGQVAVVNGQQLGVFRTFYGARNPDGSYLLQADSLRNAAGVATGLNPNRGLPQRERGTLTNGGLTVNPQRDANGQPTGTQLQKVVGDPNPDFTASLINEFTFGKLSLRVQIDGMYGQDVFNFTRRVGVSSNYGGLAEYGVELRDNFPTRRQGGLPLGWNQALFALLGDFVEDGSFTRLREVALSYELNPEASVIRSMRFTLTGRNLLLLTNYSGWDPEVNTGGQRTAVRGFDFAEVPLPRSFSLGLQVTF